ncbi:MAG: hypothetical protein MMC33_002903 [Icmadophila ericetorum]|nr:hypothetical protein [Icmadophila ericetorum]
MSTQFTNILSPPGQVVYEYPLDGKTPPPAHIPSTFIEALSVRISVFVDEQSCALDKEIDSDDTRSWHWVVYASVSGPTIDNGSNGERRTSQGGKVAVGTIRLIPPPHAPHPIPGKHYAGDELGSPAETSSLQTATADQATTLHDGREAYVKLGRLATLKEYRRLGLGRLLVNAALEWVSKNKDKVQDSRGTDPVERENWGLRREWKGLVLIHAQGEMERWWRMMGFVRDEGMGEWWEEGIRHVGMWRRMDVRNG